MKPTNKKEILSIVSQNVPPALKENHRSKVFKKKRLDSKDSVALFTITQIRSNIYVAYCTSAKYFDFWKHDSHGT